MQTTWLEKQDLLVQGMTGMAPRQFVVVQYDVGLDPNPYAQAAPEPDASWYCEVVSAHFLPQASWPIDYYYLWQHDWEAPDRAGENWARSADSAEEAAALLVNALTHGRLCRDASRMVYEIGRWSDGPGGGEPHPFPEDPTTGELFPAGPFLLAA